MPENPPLLPGDIPLKLDPGHHAEPGRAAGRLVIWAPAGADRWDRIVCRVAESAASGGAFRAAPAASEPARVRPGGLLEAMRRAFSRGEGGRSWAFPGGGSAAPCGLRRSDIVLAWAAAGAVVDEADVRSLWPGCEGVRRLGLGLFLVSGVGRPPSPGGPGPDPTREDEADSARAGRAVESAVSRGDARAAAFALADLGHARLIEGDPRGAAEALGKAREAARSLGDPRAEADAVLDLAAAEIALGRPGLASGLLEAGLALARASGDPAAEKLALDRIGRIRSSAGDHAGACVAFEAAARVAAAAGDRAHLAQLLWAMAIGYAESGRPDLAEARSAAAAALFRDLGDPRAGVYEEHRRSYGVAPASGPGPLRMALGAAKAMGRLLSRGPHLVDPGLRQGRLAACSACPHHTGLRCRLCGCFTAAKSRLAHELCPAGRWPS